MKTSQLLLVACAVLQLACASRNGTTTEIQRVSSGDLDVVVLAESDALHRGKDSFTVEFRAKADGHLVDVGTVKASATMPMPGSSPMFGSLAVDRTETPGRYSGASDFSMSGTWRTTIEWDGPNGRGSVTFSSSVQ